MTIDLILEILSLGIQAAGALIKGNPTGIELTILEIVQKGHAAYEAQTGHPINPDLIRPIDPLP